jgi:hypothetical protein
MPYKRRIKLIRPRLQLKLTMIFVGMSALALLLQYVLFLRIVSDLALKLPEDGLILLDEMSGFLTGVLMKSFALFLPVIFLVGILTTFRIAGPLYRFETYLRGLSRGEESEPCRIRKGDDLQDFCQVLNEATAPLRVRGEAQAREELRASA